MNSLNLFLSGAITIQYIIIGVFFLRYKAKTADSFFLYFAVAFALLAVERVVWVYIGMVETSEFRPTIYLFRLCAFVLIIAAVLKKNRHGSRSHI